MNVIPLDLDPVPVHRLPQAEAAHFQPRGGLAYVAAGFFESVDDDWTLAKTGGSTLRF
jgi:hypothetical protein